MIVDLDESGSMTFYQFMGLVTQHITDGELSPESLRQIIACLSHDEYFAKPILYNITRGVTVWLVCYTVNKQIELYNWHAAEGEVITYAGITEFHRDLVYVKD